MADLNLLAALDALLDSCSVAIAAERLGISTSAMSRTLGRLRESTGDALLVRAGRCLVPTPHAEAIREGTRQALEEARRVLAPSPTGLDLATLRRTFGLRANDGFVEVLGPALIAAVAAEAPFVQLQFVPKPAKTSGPLRDGSVDLEIGVLSGMGPEVRVQALFRDRFVGLVRAGHPLAGDAEVTAERYVAFGHVVASRRGRTHGPVDEALAATGRVRRIVAVVPGFSAAVAVAASSDLVALVPASYARGHGPRVRAFELPVSTEGLTVSQMWHPRLDADPAHRWLRQLLARVCRAA